MSNVCWFQFVEHLHPYDILGFKGNDSVVLTSFVYKRKT